MIVRYMEGERLLRRSVNKNVSRRSHDLKTGWIFLKTSQDDKQQTPANHQSHGQRGCISGHHHLLTTAKSHPKQTSAGKQEEAEKDASWSEREGHPVKLKRQKNPVRKSRAHKKVSAFYQRTYRGLNSQITLSSDTAAMKIWKSIRGFSRVFYPQAAYSLFLICFYCFMVNKALQFTHSSLSKQALRAIQGLSVVAFILLLNFLPSSAHAQCVEKIRQSYHGYLLEMSVPYQDCGFYPCGRRR